MEKFAARNLSPYIIAVTGLDGADVIINLLKAGVHGIVYKLDGYEQIVRAINAVREGGSYFPDNVLKVMQANAVRWETTHLYFYHSRRKSC